MGRIAPADYRAKATLSCSQSSRSSSAATAGSGYWPGGCLWGNAYLTSYVLHVMKVASTLGLASDTAVIRSRARLPGRADEDRDRPRRCSGCRSGARARRSASRCSPSTAATRTRTSRACRGWPIGCRCSRCRTSPTRWPPPTPADRATTTSCGGCTNAVRVEGDQRARRGNRHRRALPGCGIPTSRRRRSSSKASSRRGDDPQFVPGLVRWLLAARRNGRWGNTQENATALESLVGYYKKFRGRDAGHDGDASPLAIEGDRHRRRSADARRPRSRCALRCPISCARSPPAPRRSSA